MAWREGDPITPAMQAFAAANPPAWGGPNWGAIANTLGGQTQQPTAPLSEPTPTGDLPGPTGPWSIGAAETQLQAGAPQPVPYPQTGDPAMGPATGIPSADPMASLGFGGALGNLPAGTPWGSITGGGGTGAGSVGGGGGAQPGTHGGAGGAGGTGGGGGVGGIPGGVSFTGGPGSPQDFRMQASQILQNLQKPGGSAVPPPTFADPTTAFMNMYNRMLTEKQSQLAQEAAATGRAGSAPLAFEQAQMQQRAGQTASEALAHTVAQQNAYTMDVYKSQLQQQLAQLQMELQVLEAMMRLNVPSTQTRALV